MPRLRTLKDCVQLWNKRFKRWQIDKHDIEWLIREEKITSFKHGNRWVLNYDEVIEVLREYVKSYSGHPIAKEKKKAKKKKTGIVRKQHQKSIYRVQKRKDHHIWWSFGAFARIRTGGVPLRRRTLYPAEVQTHMKFIEQYKFYKNNTRNNTNFDFKALATQDVL